MLNSSSNSPDATTWAKIITQYPVDFFTTIDGQKLAQSQKWEIDRPPGWSLPSALGPWPMDRGATVLRVLSFLPGCPAELVGDFLAGTWRLRSEDHFDVGIQALAPLLSSHRVRAEVAASWVAWYAVDPVAERLDPNRALKPPVRAFIDTLRLAILTGRSAAKVAERRHRDEAHLQKLREQTSSARTPEWFEEMQLYEQIVAHWGRAQ